MASILYHWYKIDTFFYETLQSGQRFKKCWKNITIYCSRKHQGLTIHHFSYEVQSESSLVECDEDSKHPLVKANETSDSQKEHTNIVLLLNSNAGTIIRTK